MDTEQLDRLKTFIDENKGKRKFVQSVELAINFRGIDFSKPENRLNLAIQLTNEKGRETHAMVFADDANIASKAASMGAKVVSSSEIAAMASDKKKMNELLQYELVAQPSLMTQIAKSLGPFLGPKNKMPKPLIGTDIGTMISSISKSIYLRNKGKYLPTLHCAVGTEAMKPEDLAKNIDDVINAVTKKVGKQSIKSVYVKLTMSKPIRII